MSGAPEARPGVAEAPRSAPPGGLPLDPSVLRALAALAEPPGVEGAPDDLAAAPALALLVAVLRPRLIARVGLGGGAGLAALARAAERLGAPARVLGAPWGEDEPGAAARAVARGRADAVSLVEGAGAARAEAGRGTVGLLSVSAADAAAVLHDWRDALAPDAAVALDAPDAGASERALAVMREAFGPSVPTAPLGGLAVALPGVAPPPPPLRRRSRRRSRRRP